MAVRIERGRVTVKHFEYCWVRFNKIMDFSPFITCGSFCLTNTVVSFWLHWLSTQSRWPLKCTSHIFVWFLCVCMLVLHVFSWLHSTDTIQQHSRSCHWTSSSFLLTFAFASASPSWKMHSVSPNDGVWNLAGALYRARQPWKFTLKMCWVISSYQMKTTQLCPN